jgi:hypothetical protein
MQRSLSKLTRPLLHDFLVGPRCKQPTAKRLHPWVSFPGSPTCFDPVAVAGVSREAVVRVWFIGVDRGKNA